METSTIKKNGCWSLNLCLFGMSLQCTQQSDALLLSQIHPTVLNHFSWDQRDCAKFYSASLIQTSSQCAEIFQLISVGSGTGPC